MVGDGIGVSEQLLLSQTASFGLLRNGEHDLPKQVLAQMACLDGILQYVIPDKRIPLFVPYHLNDLRLGKEITGLLQRSTLVIE